MNFIFLIPMYNAEKYIIETINSIELSFYNAKKQLKNLNTYIIVNDDNSKDDSKNIVEKLVLENEKIFLMLNETNKGILETRKCLLKDAYDFTILNNLKQENTFIGMIDADDICHENRVLNQINELLKDKDLNGCGGQVLLFKDSKENHYNVLNKIGKYKESYEEIKVESIFQSSMLSGCATFKFNWIKNKIENEPRKNWWSNVKIGEDWSLVVNEMYNKNFKYKNINEVVLYYRKHDESMTNYVTDGLNTDQAKIRLQALEYIDCELTDEEHFLLITISPCRHWEVYNVDYYQNNKKTIIKDSQKLLTKIMDKNKSNSFYNEIMLEGYCNDILNNLIKIENVDIQYVDILLKLED